MADVTRTTAATRFASFDIHETSYKSIGSFGISVAVLIPKNIIPGRHPVHVKWHGGGLISGDALLQGWFSNYLVSFAHRTSSIVVLPNYRFVPEHSGADILEDIRDFWRWADRDLGRFVQNSVPGVEINLDQLLVSGDSSGGWHALHSVFGLPEGRIKAMLLLYPMVKKWCKGKDLLREWGRPTPDEEVIDRHLAQVPEGSVASSDRYLVRTELADAFSANKHRWDMAFGTDKGLHPIERLRERNAFPPTLILQGAADKSVNPEDCKDFLREVEEVFGPAAREDIHFILRKGEEHGFEIEFAEQDEPWLADELQWLEKVWLQ